ncbi:hypothetical protein [Psychromonas sp. KJ10-2]|uniref:hypothetical protein n=1 Tax=Psychromonas sp. KJ10-2 TaxID=3391822 RepID=UPI0039B51DE0
MEKLDTDKIIADAKANYWPNVDFLQLLEATETRERFFTPMLTLGADVIAQEGVVIARKGDSFNTFERLPFTMRIVVFDATNENHIEFVKSLPKSNLRTKLITTKYDRKKNGMQLRTLRKN